MKAISIRFDESIYENLRQNAEKKALTIAEYARRLIEIGLRVEAASSDDSSKNDAENEKIRWQKALSWMLETRLLSRYLVENLLRNEEKTNLAFLKTAKVKSENYVLGLMNSHEDEEE